VSEESLKILSIDELCSIMLSNIQEYLILEKLNKESGQLKKKRDELHMLYKVITEKKSEPTIID